MDHLHLSSSSSSSTPTNNAPKVRRARKAINCEPCRASKLKCDRNRPCSGCVLRGTVASCYPDQPRTSTPAPAKPPSSSSSSNANKHASPPSGAADPDVLTELAQIRRSLSVLDAHFQRPQGSSHNPSVLSSSLRDNISNRVDSPPPLGYSGFYYGSISDVSAFHTFSSGFSDPQPLRSTFPTDYQPADPSLIALLPDLPTADGLIQYYFENGTFLFKYLDEPSFMESWNQFKQTQQCDSLVLSTAFLVLAISLQYLPWRHPLLRAFPEQPNVVGARFYSYASQKLDQHRLPTLEFIEFRLLEIHWLSIAKKDCEDVWVVRNEVVSSATALGLHRDPGKWDMPVELVQRRRWAWWNILALERWLSFLFGRPLSFANHHFDTRYPSPLSSLDTHYIYYFKLCYKMGEILDDSFRISGVPYDRIRGHDRDLMAWLEGLPDDMNLDNFQLAKALSSVEVSTRRQGVQSLFIRGTFHHVRFALHRPFTTPQTRDDPTTVDSFEKAVHSAGEIIQLYGSATPDFLSNSSLATAGHINRGPFHAFAASIFFIFQLIWRPSQPGSPLFRTNIRRAVAGFQIISGSVEIAEKALGILKCFEGLYAEEDRIIVQPSKNQGEEHSEDGNVTIRGDATTTSSPSDLPSSSSMLQTFSIPPHVQFHGVPSSHQFIDASPYPLASSEEEAVWSASLENIDSAEWSRFISSSLVGGALVM